MRLGIAQSFLQEAIVAVVPFTLKRDLHCSATSKICFGCDVRKLAICAALDDIDLGALEGIMTSKSLATNAILVEEGDVKARVYSLTSGMLRISTLLADGRRQIVGFIMPGDYIGLADDEIYLHTIEAVTPSELCSFSTVEMEGLMDKFPRLKDRLQQMMKATLRAAHNNQLVLGRLAPVEKLASFLLVLAMRSEQRGGKLNIVHLPMSRTDIADYLGLTIETVSRSLTKLKTQGLIQMRDVSTIEILARRALIAVSGMNLN